MKDVLYLAWRYLAYNRGKTAVLVASIMLVVYLPVTLRVLVARSAAELTARAEATPLIVGEKGSALELVLNALYFESAAPETTRYAELLRIQESGLAEAIPLYTGFRARGHPIIGTTLEYLAFRGLAVAAGRAFGAYVDLRPESPTFGVVETVELVPGIQVLVPSGVANGFQALDDDNQYLYCFDREWRPDMEGAACNPLDPDLGIPWPLPVDLDDPAAISAKDRSAPSFAELADQLREAP